MNDLSYEVQGHIATILLNRPEHKNAFTIPMVNAWADALERAQHDDQVRAILVAGAGGSFCSGVDLSDFKGEKRTPLQEKQLLMDNVHRVALTLEQVDKPVIAAIDGPAVGAGMDMALLCDIRFASPSARFSEGYIKVGLVPGDGGSWLLPRVVGHSTALRLLWTGDFVEAEDSARLGIVEYVVRDESVGDHARAFAQRLAEQPPQIIRMIKRAVRQGANHDLATALDLMSSHMAVITTTEDSKEAYAAFTERRRAKFRGE